jgi:hypothetical protein
MKTICIVIALLCSLNLTANPSFTGLDGKEVQYNTVEFVKYKDGKLYIFADGVTKTYRVWKPMRLSTEYLFLLLPMDIEEYDMSVSIESRKIKRIHTLAQIAAFDDRGILISREFEDLMPVLIPWERLSVELYRKFGKHLPTWTESLRCARPIYKNEYSKEYLQYVAYTRWVERYGRVPVSGNSFSKEEKERKAYEKAKQKELHLPRK